MIGWITTWDIRCGIATYSAFLSREFDEKVTILCQKGEGERESDGVIPCWERDSNDFSGILSQISILGIEKVIIQHQPGLLRFSYLNELLLILSRMDVKVIITMHNTRDRSLVFPSKRIEKAVEGLRTVSTIMVHSKADVENLLALGIKANVTMIPHGIYPPPTEDAEGLRLSGKTIATFGFLLPHKGQIELIEAFARLEGWDSLLLLCAVREGTGKTLDKCKHLIAKHSLENRVQLVTEFLDDEVAIKTLAGCDLLVFPYQNTKESASGAVRMGVASGAPIAVTPIPIFDDINGAIRLPGTSVDAIVKGIQAIDESQMNASKKAIVELRDSLQWSEVANRLQALF